MARDDYIEVSERLRTFIEMYPQGSLDSEWCYVQRDGEEWLVVKAYAYRDQDDKRPGVGHAWEPIPGRTPYTRGSELQVGETSAWGRALAALGIAVHKGVASANEVRAAQARTPDLAQVKADSMPSYRTPSGAVKQEGNVIATAKQVGMIKGTMTKQHSWRSASPTFSFPKRPQSTCASSPGSVSMRKKASARVVGRTSRTYRFTAS